jgi:peptidoglycan/xylan/chitin deacetylase (PgdA/CDA1 family)
LSLRSVTRDFALQVVSVLRLNELALALRRSSGRIVVVEMHETPRAQADQLCRQLEWVCRNFTLITPELFARALATKAPAWPGSRPAILFTFDDGRESNYLVAAPMLESFGARGIFFVVPQFIGLVGNAARDFYYSKIDIRNLAPTAPAQEEVWKPMNPAQLADLARRGHWIGSHTLSHAQLAGLPAPDLESEVKDSARQIACWTGQPVDAFAWTYSWDAIDRAAWDAVKQAHRFCFAPCPGTVDLAADSPSLIWRKEIEAYYSLAEYKFMYSGLVDLIWVGKRRKLQRMLRADPA